jgi:hypothetical protein
LYRPGQFLRMFLEPVNTLPIKEEAMTKNHCLWAAVLMGAYLWGNAAVDAQRVQSRFA